ncbi:MAG: protein-glutamate O-methyltransferase CheR [Herpetosiphon sp.]
MQHLAVRDRVPPSDEREDIEIELLLEAVSRFYGFDFRNYALASLRRRIWNVIRAEGLQTVSGLQEKLLHQPDCMDRLLQALTIHQTAMFRDPSFYGVFRRQVVPLLHTYPYLRIWHAGCSTGEEVYSMAIVLKEEGLYDRCRIYATDMNEPVLHKARAGRFALDKMQEYTVKYLRAGGTRSLSEYYAVDYKDAVFSPSLRSNVTFSPHNLAMDRSFNEFNVILCRNVMIYFNPLLQEHVHSLIYNSLSLFGVLGLGHAESLAFTPYEHQYAEIEGGERLYRRVI